MPKKRVKQTIHSICSPLNFPQQQNNSLSLPLSFTNKQRSLYNPLNVQVCSTAAKKSLSLPFRFTTQPKVGYCYTSQPFYTQLYTPIYLQNCNWLLRRQLFLGKNDEYRKEFSKCVKLAAKCKNMVSGHFRACSTCSLRTFTLGQCVQPPTIMKFRRNVHKYSTNTTAYHFRMQSECEQRLVPLGPCFSDNM